MLRVRPSSRTRLSAFSVSSSGTSGFGQCRSSRSSWSTPSRSSDCSASRSTSSAVASSCGTFVVRKISFRGTPLSAIPRPTSRSFSYARACRSAGSRAPARPGRRRSRPARSPARCRIRWPEPSRPGRRSSVSIRHGASAIPLLRLATSRAISSAGRAPPRQGGGHWFEPSIAHESGASEEGRPVRPFFWLCAVYFWLCAADHTVPAVLGSAPLFAPLRRTPSVAARWQDRPRAQRVYGATPARAPSPVRAACTMATVTTAVGPTSWFDDAAWHVCISPLALAAGGRRLHERAFPSRSSATPSALVCASWRRRAGTRRSTARRRWSRRTCSVAAGRTCTSTTRSTRSTVGS